MTQSASLHKILEQYWGYSAFRPLQLEIIESVIGGEDTLALLPTGGGKSLCFQVPALAMEGVCLVVSPLIALMKDQVSNLKSKGIKAEAIYSGMRYKDVDRILDNAAYGDVKLIYLSPERLSSELAIERIKKMNINFIAVDEAHCISQWGYDFRPAYLKIAEIRQWHPKVPVLALTATATLEVREDIQEKLLFNNKKLMKKSFQRKNLIYAVVEEENKLPKLLEILQKINGSSVVYVRSRKKTKETALYLIKHKISADIYHAGLSSKEREEKQAAWINNRVRVIVATNAFGMGIDKADVRTVVHLELPDSLEAYFQEAGRAGRDGNKAYAILLYEEADKLKLLKNKALSFPKINLIKTVYRALGSYLQIAIGSSKGKSFDFEIEDFCRKFSFDILATYNVLKILDKEAYISLSDSILIPSKLHVLIGKVELYDFFIKNEKYKLLLNKILRAYQGAFKYPISINEYLLSKDLKISQEIIQKQLTYLHKSKIVNYIPQKDKPQLTFITEKIPADDLVFDMKGFKLREKKFEERINHAINYVEQDECRSVILLRYFGEESRACGYCDFCKKRANANLDNKEYNNLKKKIKWLLEKEKLSIKELTESFNPKKRELVLKVTEHLLDEKFIKKENELLIWKE